VEKCKIISLGARNQRKCSVCCNGTIIQHTD